MKPEKTEAPSHPSEAPEPLEPLESDDLRNPLWIVVAGMAWLFGVLLVIVAFGGSG
jgi:hypothetical protein